MTDQEHASFAAAAFDYAVSMCINTTEGTEREALLAVEEDPTPGNLRAALAVADGKPWRPLFEGALLEIGVVCAARFLGARNE
tara:strand:- start:16878 stop:17126 length:249 start_codon:yes stop_codon:yes gene_type:complete